MCSRYSRGIPDPVSVTLTSAPVSLAAAATTTTPSAGVYEMALSTRLPSTRSSWLLSPGGCGRSGDTFSTSSTPEERATARMPSTTTPSISDRSRGSWSIRTPRPSLRAASSSASTRDSRRSVLRRAMPRTSSDARRDASDMDSSNRSRHPRMTLKGERRSCTIRSTVCWRSRASSVSRSASVVRICSCLTRCCSSRTTAVRATSAARSRSASTHSIV